MNKGEFFGGWRERAACRGLDPNLFFPVQAGGSIDDQNDYEAEVSAAQEVCAGCTVRKLCLEFASQTGEKEGIWGGLDIKNQKREARNERDRAHRAKRNS